MRQPSDRSGRKATTGTKARRILSEYGDPAGSRGKDRSPHIIVVMGEAFYDVDRIPGSNSLMVAIRQRIIKGWYSRLTPEGS